MTATDPARPPRKSSRWEVVALIVLAPPAVLVTAFWALMYLVWVPAIWTGIDEAGVPSRSPVPAELVVTDDKTDCASGGCWRELSVQPPAGQSATDLISTWDVEEGCAPQTWIDLRRVCTEVSIRGQEVRVHLQYDRL